MAKDTHFPPNAHLFMKRNTADIHLLREEGRTSAVPDKNEGHLRNNITRGAP